VTKVSKKNILEKMSPDHKNIFLIPPKCFPKIFLIPRHKKISPQKYFYQQILIFPGMGINGIDSNGLTALHHAAEQGHIEMVDYLIREGIRIDTPDLQGYTVYPLHTPY
jgi:ankyrin repeat protein